MRQQEIYGFPDPSGSKSHPCVIISPDALAANPRYLYVNVIPCQTLYAGQKPLPGDVILLEKDGVERKSVVNCLFGESRVDCLEPLPGLKTGFTGSAVNASTCSFTGKAMRVAAMAMGLSSQRGNVPSKTIIKLFGLYPGR